MSIFLNMVLKKYLNASDGGEEKNFHHDFQWGGRCFLKHFFEKSNQNLLWVKSFFFFENWRNPSRDDIIFSIFLGKSCDDILWGKCMFFENGHKYSKKRVFWMKLFWKILDMIYHWETLDFFMIHFWWPKRHFKV